MIKKIMIGASLFLLAGCATKQESLPKEEVTTKVIKKSGYFTAYWNKEAISIPLPKEYQEITPKSDKELFRLLDLLEQGPHSTNIAFLLSNADYMGLITGLRKDVKDSYIIVRSSDELKKHQFTQKEFTLMSSLVEKNYKRLIESNYIKGIMDEYVDTLKENVSSEFHQELPVKGVIMKPLAFKKLDERSFLIESLLTFKSSKGSKDDKKILSMNSSINYGGKFVSIIVNSSVDGELSKSFIAEKEDFTKAFVGAFKK